MSFVFGPDVVTEYLEKLDLDLICRAHQVRISPSVIFYLTKILNSHTDIVRLLKMVMSSLPTDNLSPFFLLLITVENLIMQVKKIKLLIMKRCLNEC